ncbi:acyl-CoA dehydrogenase [Sorangium cellulosum]|uniref:Acyl-CoA dehydrogenase n=2 Tax=Sorangium cellulosum TaxID=56 RepID=A0A2L0F213_SORCE|nr:acyl-CoA dehydrogenase [Sorangium cellulosum]
METERRGYLPDAIVEAVQAAGLFDMFRPRRHGGIEASLRTAVEVQIELGRGCGSTAWVVSQLNGSALFASMFPSGFREEIFAERVARVASSFLPPSRPSVRRVPGGYVLGGSWPFCTGCRHASWIGVGAPCAGDGQATRPGWFFLPASQVEMKDDWHVSGLSGTGSSSVTVTDVFVPEHRVLDAGLVFEEGFVAEGLDGPLYRMPLFAGQLLHASSCALGMALAARSEFESRLRGRAVSYTLYTDRAEAVVTHLQIAEATVKMEAARLLLHRSVDDVEGCAARGEIMRQEGRLRARMHAAYAASLCRQAIEILIEGSGGSSLALSNPIQRIARDARALCLHGAYSLQPTLETYGRSLLGLPTNAPIV